MWTTKFSAAVGDLNRTLAQSVGNFCWCKVKKVAQSRIILYTGAEHVNGTVVFLSEQYTLPLPFGYTWNIASFRIWLGQKQNIGVFDFRKEQHLQ